MSLISETDSCVKETVVNDSVKVSRTCSNTFETTAAVHLTTFSRQFEHVEGNWPAFIYINGKFYLTAPTYKYTSVTYTYRIQYNQCILYS